MFLANKRTLINHRILLLDLTTSAGLGASAVAINRDERVVVDVFLGLIKIAGLSTNYRTNMFSLWIAAEQWRLGSPQDAFGGLNLCA